MPDLEESRGSTEKAEWYPGKGARKLLTEGVDAARRAAQQPNSGIILVDLANRLNDMATVMLFGSSGQRAEVEQYMNRNRRAR